MWRRLRSFLGARQDASRSGGSPGTPPHDWRECRPALVWVDLKQTGAQAPERDKQNLHAAVLEVVWSRLRSDDKRAFHRFSCLESKDPDDLAIAQHLSATLRAELIRRGL
jgi:hypothetical protein